MTRNELMARMSSKEFDTWQAYNALWPIGDNREDIRIGVLASSIINAMIAIWTKGTPDKNPADFMLFRDDDDTSLEEISMKFQAATGYEEEAEIPEGYNKFGYRDD